MRLELFGNVRILENGRSKAIEIRRPSALLLYLAYRREWLSRDELRYLFNPDVIDSVAKRKLRIQIYRAKQVPWGKRLEVNDGQLRFLIDSDVADFDKAIQEKNYLKAIKIYKGKLFGDSNLSNSANFSSWLEHERRLRHEQWLKANLEYSKILEKKNSPEKAVKYLSVVLQAEPMDEKTLQKYMLLNNALNEREKALRAYNLFKRYLQKELGLPPQEATVNIAAAIRQKQKNLPANFKDFNLERNINLPHIDTRLIGREKELKILSSFYNDGNSRLVSIIGPGGSGKTRLSIELAKQLSPNFEDGVYFVALAAIKSAGLISAEIAEQLKLDLGGSGNAENVLLSFLRKKQLLLVLDNFEHLLDGLEQIQTILFSCPHVHILLSSRERLKLPTERVLDIHGLSFEATSGKKESSAVELFLEAAKRLGHFEFSKNDMKNIDTICRKLEGMPMAIELAASWLRVLRCEEINNELQESFELLNRQNSQHLQNHSSQSMVFEQSWKLLSQAEKQALAKLSIFEVSFDRAAAEQIANVHLSLLFSLVDKSLLVFDERFRFHELIRYFAAKKLNQQEKLALQRKYAAYFSRLLAKHGAGLHCSRQLEYLAELAPEIDNFRQFWKWSIELGEYDLLDSALNTLFDLYSLKSYFLEGVEIFDRAARAVKKKNLNLYYRLIARKGRFLMRLGKYNEDLSALKSCRRYFEKNSLSFELIAVYLTLGTIYRNRGELQKAKDLYRKCLLHAKADKDAYREALAINNLGIIAYREGKIAEAKRKYEKSLSIFKSAGLEWATTLALNNLGIIYYTQNQFDEAKRFFSSNISTFEKVGDIKGKALSISNLGTIAYEQGYYEKAIQYHKKSLSLALQIGEIWAIANDYANLAFSYLELNDFTRTRINIKKSLSNSKELNIPPMMLYALIVLAGLEHKQGKSQKARELFQFILAHPASSTSVRDRCNKLMQRLAIPAVVGTAGSRAGLELGKLVSEYLES